MTDEPTLLPRHGTAPPGAASTAPAGATGTAPSATTGTTRTATTGPTPTAATPTTDPDLAALPFDRALAELQGVVARLETGGLPLEESIVLYERGVALHDHCARLLTDAELRVQRLVDQAGGGLRALDFDPDDLTET